MDGSPGAYRVEDQASIDLIHEFALDARRVLESTLAKYAVHVEEFRVWLLHESASDPDRGRAQLVDATPQDVHRFLAYLRRPNRFAAAETARGGRALSASSRKGAYSALRSFYRFAVRLRIVTLDPTAPVDAPRVLITPGLVLSRDELRLLLDAPGSPRTRIQTYLLAYTLARAGAIRALRWSDVDFHQRTLLLHTKNNAHDTIGIHPALMTELRRWFIYQETLAERYDAIGTAKQHPETDFVLLTRNGKQLPKNTITKQLKARATRLGLHLHVTRSGEVVSRVSAHTLRRSVATIRLNDGEPLDAVSDMLMHRQLDTTRRHYAFAGNERRRATFDAISL